MIRDGIGDGVTLVLRPVRVCVGRSSTGPAGAAAGWHGERLGWRHDRLDDHPFQHPAVSEGAIALATAVAARPRKLPLALRRLAARRLLSYLPSTHLDLPALQTSADGCARLSANLRPLTRRSLNRNLPCGPHNPPTIPCDAGRFWFCAMTAACPSRAILPRRPPPWHKLRDDRRPIRTDTRCPEAAHLLPSTLRVRVRSHVVARLSTDSLRCAI